MHGPFVEVIPEGPSDDPQAMEADIAAHVSSLEALHARLNPDVHISSDNYELALQQLDGLRDFVWGGIDPLVRYLVPRIVKRGNEIDPEHLNECLEIACREETVKGHKKLIRRALDANKSAGLNELASDVYNPASKQYGQYRRRLRNDVLYRMQDIGLWVVAEIEMKKSKSGGKYHPGYNISAGPVLMSFHRHFWLPYAERYLRFACNLQQKEKKQCDT